MTVNLFPQAIVILPTHERECTSELMKNTLGTFQQKVRKATSFDTNPPIGNEMWLFAAPKNRANGQSLISNGILRNVDLRPRSCKRYSGARRRW
jgi:hypothetical protein